MLSIVVFGQGMQIHLVIPCNVILDMTDAVTMNMVTAVISEAMDAVFLGRSEYAKGKQVVYRVQVLYTVIVAAKSNPEDN